MASTVEIILRDLVAMPSVTDNSRANNIGLDYVEKYLQNRGMRVKRSDYDGKGTLVATTRNTMRPMVMLAAHLDVAPAPEQLFTLKEKGGKLYGRGVWDMKYAIAAYLAAVNELGPQLSQYDLGIMIVTDEEVEDTQTIRLLQHGYGCEVAILPDGSNDWHIETKAKGRWTLKVRISGKSAHGSRPWEGDSASVTMIEFLHELGADFAGQGPDTNTLNIGLIQSGSNALNQLPDSAEAALDIRLAGSTSHAILLRRLHSLAKTYGATIEEIDLTTPLVHDSKNEYSRMFADSIKQVTGVTSKGFTSLGTSDAPYFIDQGIPCIVFSPPGGGRHSEHEWIEKKGLLELPAVIQLYLEKVAVAQPTHPFTTAALSLPS